MIIANNSIEDITVLLGCFSAGSVFFINPDNRREIAVPKGLYSSVHICKGDTIIFCKEEVDSKTFLSVNKKGKVHVHFDEDEENSYKVATPEMIKKVKKKLADVERSKSLDALMCYVGHLVRDGEMRYPQLIDGILKSNPEIPPTSPIPPCRYPCPDSDKLWLEMN